MNYRDPVSTKEDGVAREITASEALALQECGLDVCVQFPEPKLKEIDIMSERAVAVIPALKK